MIEARNAKLTIEGQEVAASTEELMPWTAARLEANQALDEIKQIRGSGLALLVVEDWNAVKRWLSLTEEHGATIHLMDGSVCFDGDVRLVIAPQERCWERVAGMRFVWIGISVVQLDPGVLQKLVSKLSGRGQVDAVEILWPAPIHR